MSEMNLDNQERIETMKNAINKAAEIIAGPGANPLEVFPDPRAKERRADVVWGVELTEDQQEAFRDVMAELGPGRDYNIGPDDTSFAEAGYIALFEGGQPHKMIAQLNIVDEAKNRPALFVFSGSPDRKLGEGEKSIAARLLRINEDEVADYEFDLAEQIVCAQPNFEKEYSPKSNTIGTLDGTPVRMMSIGRTYNEDGSYTQLSNKEKMELVSKEGYSVGFVTSATYQPSNELSAIEASSVTGADIRVLTYGIHELARVKGEPASQPTIAQLGAEAHKVAQLLTDY